MLLKVHNESLSSTNNLIKKAKKDYKVEQKLKRDDIKQENIIIGKRNR